MNNENQIKKKLKFMAENGIRQDGPPRFAIFADRLQPVLCVIQSRDEKNEKRTQTSCRHRSEHRPAPRTATGFWSIDFPTSPEILASGMMIDATNEPLPPLTEEQKRRRRMKRRRRINFLETEKKRRRRRKRRTLTRTITGKNHHVFCDNYFTSVHLAEDLMKDQVYSCGMIKANSSGYPKELEKNNPTCLEEQEALKSYNANIGGVDRSDQSLSYYAVGLKSRKWWRYLFWFLNDLSIVNALILEMLAPHHSSQTQLQFRCLSY
ncbi:uncharacterized protein LOC116307142 [Actinia tenebrosa]|uniref:Uncharacterized protein LOC116307142 n=1 Tax=Actinia tenebrosa TaxID=6105 RepID=A0A6P8J028_ACTTE|nr:uncharacterized protein LOC116307142 [Actinia tenebrosa]